MRIDIMIDKEQKTSTDLLAVLKAELYKNLLPVYTLTNVRIRKSSANGSELSGVRLDDDKKTVMNIRLAV